MQFYYDCEFLEGPQRKRFLGIPVGKTKPTVDLISIGVVSEDGREYYAVSNEFNLYEAWNRFDEIEVSYGFTKRVYWIRDNVLRPIFDELLEKELSSRVHPLDIDQRFVRGNMQYLISKYGRSLKDIKWELTKFMLDPNDEVWSKWLGSSDHYWKSITDNHCVLVELYGYYSAYDHVCLSWIYGKMIDLPNGIPMYTKDLKQVLDEKVVSHLFRWGLSPEKFSEGLEQIKNLATYPIQEGEHNALEDARWNKRLHEFLNTIK